ncbi:ricin-type beta-trefoil lectin domain protein [Rhizoctonia solani AG-3 Rhs1AP]|uniref:Ricin-type beta-trefoil lectin domain protein n=1 Tax=Rhizoctonia solani AG-3 Rhs1AP TaxID=1086054 RepID=X8JRL3_9AGAM|nr:ricin-type beta-trefoil lectin domain protein [Rhizoctonia solani AG-3 Rhs1AP]
MQALAVYAMQLAEPGLQLFRQGVEHLPIDETVEPGTYHIVSGLTGTVLQVSEHDRTKVVSWQIEKQVEKIEQQWYLQRSGGGYTFKNRKVNDLYLSVASTDTHALVTASKCPSTWVLLKIGDRYGIKLAEGDKLIDLHFGRRTNGTEVHIWPSDGSAKQTWKLVRIGDGVGESPQEKKSCKAQDFTDKNGHVERLEKEVSQLKDEVAKKDQKIAQHENTIHQLRVDLEARESNHLKSKVSQQQTEIASLQAKIDRLEYLVSQLREGVGRSPMESR